MGKREPGVSAEGILEDAARDIWHAVIMAPGDRDHQYAADELEAISRLGGINTDIGQGIIARAKQEAWGPPEHPDGADPVKHPRTGVGGGDWRHGMVTADQLRSMTFAPLKYIVPGLIVEGLTILAGRPKIGKSWLVLLLCIAVAAGKAALGRPGACEQGDVLYLALEDGNRRLQRRMTKLLGVFGNWPVRLSFKTKWRRFDQGGLDDIRAWCASCGAPRLIVVDTLAKVRAPANSKSSPYQNDHDALSGLQRLAEELGIGVIVNHHDRKMDADDVFDTVSGTLGLTGAVDTIVVLAKKSQGTTLHIRGRDLEEESSLAMSFDRETANWSVLGGAAEIHRSVERKAIVEAIAQAGGALSPKDIMAATGRADRNAVDQLLFKMTRDGELVKPAQGRYSLPSLEPGKKVRLGVSLDEIEENANLTVLPGSLESKKRTPLTPAQQAAVDRAFAAQQFTPPPDAGTVGSVSSQKTDAMKARLTELGYNQEQIQNMTPQEGWAAIDKATREWAEVNLR